MGNHTGKNKITRQKSRYTVLMVLGSFQCQGVLLLWYMVGLLCLQHVRDGWAVFFFFCFFFCLFFFFHLIHPIFSNASSLWRWLDILKYCGTGRYNHPTVVVSYYWSKKISNDQELIQSDSLRKALAANRMNSSFPNRWSFSYLKFTKYVTNIIDEPKYKHRQQEQ